MRIELFGDRVESIREFDPVTQRSVGKIESVRILPAKEVLMTEASGRSCVVAAGNDWLDIPLMAAMSEDIES